MYSYYGGDAVGGITAAANTHIQVLIPPSGPAPAGTVNTGYEKVTNVSVPSITRPTVLNYTQFQTLQTVVCARPIGKTTLNAAVAGGATAINLAADPGLLANNNLAANDFLAIRETDGVTRLYKVNNLANPQTLNVTPALVCGAAAGTKVWDFGITTDTDPATGLAHGGPYQPTVNNTSSLPAGSEGSVFPSHEADSPILVDSNNAGPGAGVIALLAWAYTKY